MKTVGAMKTLGAIVLENVPNVAELIEQREPSVRQLRGEIDGTIVFEPELAWHVLERIARYHAEHAAAEAVREHIEGER